MSLSPIFYRDFSGDIDSVLAAYNGEKENVRKWLKTNETGERYLDTEKVTFAEMRDYLKSRRDTIKYINICINSSY
jgi:soluble lytic murein transglycosylase-like protein